MMEDDSMESNFGSSDDEESNELSESDFDSDSDSVETSFGDSNDDSTITAASAFSTNSGIDTMNQKRTFYINGGDVTELHFHATILDLIGDENADNQEISRENLQEIKRVISQSSHLKDLSFRIGAGEHSSELIQSLFQGLRGSGSIQNMRLYDNVLNSQSCIRGLVPFVRNLTSLKKLLLRRNRIGSDGFNELLRMLPDCVKRLHCSEGDIAGIMVVPPLPGLNAIRLRRNRINADGCRGLAGLLGGGDAALKELSLQGNEIDDEGVRILVNALEDNKSLMRLNLFQNAGISVVGRRMILKLVSDISSIKATMGSNHTLRSVKLDADEGNERVGQLISRATRINNEFPHKAGEKKVILLQLSSKNRTELMEFMRGEESVFGNIDSLYLPEVLSTISQNHDQADLFAALKASISGLISAVSKKECIGEEIDTAEGSNDTLSFRGTKRRRS